MLSMTMAAMEMTVVSTAMPTIVAELGGLSLYAWVTTAYLLTSTVTVPLYGKIADLRGRKPVLLFGITVFLLGSVACALARTMPLLIAARAFQGLGAGAMQPMALTLIGDLFDLKERGRIQPLFGAVWALAALLGPLVGGVLVERGSWPDVFWINVPFGLAAIVVLGRALHEDVEVRKAKLDVLGAALLSGGVVALLVGTEGHWRAPLFALAAALLALFVAVERRALDPLVPLSLFGGRVLATTSVLSALLGGVTMGVGTYVPLFVQATLHGSPTAAGAAATPLLGAWTVAAFAAGVLVPRFGFRPIIWSGAALTAVASIALAIATGTAGDVGPTSWWTLAATTALVGVGMGAANTALLLVVQSAVPWSQRGVATAGTMFARTIGATVAVGTMGALLASTVRSEAHVPPEVLREALLGRGRSAPGLELALSHGIFQAFVVVALLGVAGLLAALLLPRIPLAAERDARGRAAAGTTVSEADVGGRG
ncbi:MAG: MFS transporter [Myxococcales bacterium]|nr:MFS transporter [Myxococcales bacterium]